MKDPAEVSMFVGKTCGWVGLWTMGAAFYAGVAFPPVAIAMFVGGAILFAGGHVHRTRVYKWHYGTKQNYVKIEETRQRRLGPNLSSVSFKDLGDEYDGDGDGDD
jgi:hypothetical protein